ncbi:GTP pyrophosphokinase [Alloiococcus sp. CFN-8]|uniref:GTP pyrophosphokinase n=1 Tax=Alloiococcus sp. CFN-8 TaxID=3416081 RepID=UPI003CEB05F8
MLYTPLTKKALLISFNAHKEQIDKSGMPYVYHPYELATQMDDEYSTCVALLHDVVEDTEITLEDLENEGFPREVIEAIAMMTHDDKVPYMDYIEEIKRDAIARKVKLADLHHNSNIDRLDKLDEKALKRIEKYHKAIEILTER